MIPYMHQDLAAEHIADIYAQASRDRVARIARQARRLRRRSGAATPAFSLFARPAARPGHAADHGNRPATEPCEVA